MMSLNNNAGASAIFYLCATSTALTLLMTLGTICAADAAANIVQHLDQQLQPHQLQPEHNSPWPQNASPNMHNSNEMPAHHDNPTKSNNLSHFEKNNRNDDGIMALSPSLSTSSRDRNNGSHSNNVHHSDQHSFEMENSRKYLHLDEHNFVATTPKIFTTKSPNRYAHCTIQHIFDI